MLHNVIMHVLFKTFKATKWGKTAILQPDMHITIKILHAWLLVAYESMSWIGNGCQTGMDNLKILFLGPQVVALRPPHRVLINFPYIVRFPLVDQY